jgi:membrane fusion protein (multidrug efflux system)
MTKSRIGMLAVALTSLSLPACQSQAKEDEPSSHDQEHIVVTSPAVKDVIVTQPYVCQIHSQKHIEVRALEEGYLEAISVKEGQQVKEDQVLFRVIPALYKAKWDAEVAEAEFARVEYNNSKKLFEKNIVSDRELKLYEAKLAKAEAKAKLAEAEFGFTEVKARFSGIIDRLYQQQGSLVGKGDLLTTLSDNSKMWVYFNVPEARYFEFKKRAGKTDDPSQLKLVDATVQLKLADGTIFQQDPGNVVTVEGKFDNSTGNIQFRSDFPNPDRLLRHGQTGTILIHRTVHKATVIPQRAVFEILDKEYVYVVDKDNVVHQRPIQKEYELEDIFVIKSGLQPGEKFILEGGQYAHDSEKIKKYDTRSPEAALTNMKQHAE